MHVPIVEIDLPVGVHTHHTESVDPTLAQWINDLLHDLLGWGPWAFVVVFGIVIVAIPVWLIINALRHPPIDDEAREDNQ